MELLKLKEGAQCLCYFFDRSKAIGFFDTDATLKKHLLDSILYSIQTAKIDYNTDSIEIFPEDIRSNSIFKSVCF